ncbi:Ig domain-containing protein [Streptomyces coerulescens]|uniref:Ig domain-containing protein n=1 Tax=Streptomyces coerulescens TaxID=29304 RepID=A0ABW0CUB3_STRCD
MLGLGLHLLTAGVHHRLPAGDDGGQPVRDAGDHHHPQTIRYSVTSGALPAGLTLNQDTGGITGIPTTGATFCRSPACPGALSSPGPRRTEACFPLRASRCPRLLSGTTVSALNRPQFHLRAPCLRGEAVLVD